MNALKRFVVATAVAVAISGAVALPGGRALAQSPDPPPVLLLLDESAIDHGPPPHLIPADAVNKSHSSPPGSARR